MRCVLNTRATFYAVFSLIAVISIAAIQVIDPPEDLFHMAARDAAADIDDMATRITSLREWFSTSAPDGAVTANDVQTFLDELAEVHFMPPAAEDGRAAAIIDAGYSSLHMIAELTTADLLGLNFLPGNAKKMASYLGSAAAARPPAQVLMNNSVAASAQHSAQIGGAVAAAVTSANSKVQLFNSSDKRPTVSSAMKWAKKHMHLEKSNTQAGGFYLTGVIPLLIDDATVDLSPHILVDPAHTSDASYVREVLSSMIAEQIEKYGSSEVSSALKLMQSVIANIADYKMDEYIHHVSAFNAYEGSTDANSVKARFNHFFGLLMEVRYHKMFEVPKAVEKMVAVISPMPFLVNEVFAMWSSSPKDQATLALALKHVKEAVDIPVFVKTPDKADVKDKDKKDKDKSSGRRNNWRDRNQSSGKSQSSDKRI